MSSEMIPSYSLASRRIRHILSQASHQEIIDGLSFYPAAHSLCHILHILGAPSISHAAGIYSALSPLNTWKGNVDGCFAIVRDKDKARVTTTKANLSKALRIYHGEDPSSVLVGSKTRAFWRAMSDPNNLSHIPVDRHLARIVVGQRLDNNELSRLLSSESNYNRIADYYLRVGEEENGIGNRVAAIAWFVQRRLQDGIVPSLPQSEIIVIPCPKCKSSSTHAHGRRRRLCLTCRSTYTLNPIISRRGESIGREWIDDKGYVCVYLGLSHPYANSGGWQRKARFIAQEELGRKLLTEEQVDHKDKDKANNTPRNLRVLLDESHGRYHMRGSPCYILAEYDERVGKIVEYDEPRRML